MATGIEFNTPTQCKLSAISRCHLRSYIREDQGEARIEVGDCHAKISDRSGKSSNITNLQHVPYGNNSGRSAYLSVITVSIRNYPF